MTFKALNKVNASLFVFSFFVSFIVGEIFLHFYLSTNNETFYTDRFEQEISVYLEGVGNMGRADLNTFDKIHRTDVSLDSKGLRVTPQFFSDQTIVFFGCSFLFGEGLSDKQTIPFKLSEHLEKSIVNLSFPGLGPHQLLALIEHDYLDQYIEDDNISQFSYLAMNEHFIRATKIHNPYRGRSDSFYTSHYTLENSRPVFQGVYESESQFKSQLVSYFGLSKILSFFVDRYYELRVAQMRESDSKQKLFKAIIETIGEKIHNKFGIQFSIYFYGPTDSLDYELLYEVAEKSEFIRLVNLYEHIPELSNKSEYTIENDGHPNSKAVERVVDFLKDDFQLSF